MKKECLYGQCDHIFSSDIKGYEACPKCGSATIPTEVKTDTDSKQREISDKVYRDMVVYSRYGHYFKCPYGYECKLLGHYEPICEQRVFRHECLKPLHHNQWMIETKLDKILDHLNLNDQ